MNNMTSGTTAETATPTKDSLASFQSRRNRWKNSPRLKMVAMPMSPLPPLQIEPKTTTPLPVVSYPLSATTKTGNKSSFFSVSSSQAKSSLASSTIVQTDASFSSSKSESKAPAPSSSSYPPMSTKAPAPFGGAKTSTSSATPSTGKASNPFSGVSLVPSATEGSAPSSSYPPMSTKAPTPFGGAKTSTSSTTPSTGKSSNPFSGVSLVPSATKGSAPSSSYPPMSTKAPTPFGGAKTSTSSATPSTGKASNPFSDVSLVPSATKGSAPSSSYPPMSTKAPTPFGSFQAKSSERSYPPMSSIAPTPLGVVSFAKNASTQQTPTTEAIAGGESYRNRLIVFYKVHNSSKLDTVDSTLEKYKGKEEELFRKLQAKYDIEDVSSKSKFPLPSGDGPHCYVEFAVDDKNVGRVVVKLYKDKAPLACENFRCLCTGEITRQRQLCYLGSKVHRIVPGFCIQMGDFTRGDGRGGTSIYAPNSEHGDTWGKFKDENFLQHSKPGLLSMANSGPNSNSSQVFFTLKHVPNLDGKHVVFGEVVEGMDVVEALGKLNTNKKSQAPLQHVAVAACGEIVDGKDVSLPSKGEESTTQGPFGFSSLTVGNNSGPAASKTPPFSSSSPFTSSSAFSSAKTAPFSFGGSTTSSTQATFGTSANASSSSQTTTFSFGSSASAGTTSSSRSSSPLQTTPFTFGSPGSGTSSSKSTLFSSSSPSPFTFGESTDSGTTTSSPFSFGGPTST